MAEDIGALKVTLGLDSASFSQSMASVDRNLKALGQELRGAQNMGKSWGDSLGGLTSKQDVLTRTLSTQGNKVDRLREAYEKSKAETGENSKATENLAIQLNRAQAEYNRTETELGQVSAALKKQRDEIKLSESGWTQLGETMKDVGEKLQTVGTKMKDVGKELSMKVTAPLVAVGVAAVKMTMDFEAQMSRVGAIAGATGGEMDALKKSAMDLGANTSKSASEVAIAMEDMAAMGFTAIEIIGAMPGVISASEASGESLALSAQTVAAALNIWGLEATEAGRVADVLAMAANASAAGIGDMQIAFKYAGAPAAALGIEMEDVAAAIGIMTDAGLDGSNAGTSLRASLLALNNPAKAQEKMMKQLGVTMRDGEGEALSLSEMIGNLVEATEHMTEADKVATLGKLVGTQAVSGFLSLMKAGPVEIDKLSDALRNSAGASAETAAKMKDNLKGAFEELGGALETAAITIGNMLIPTLRKVVEAVQGMVEKFTELSPATQKTILAIAGIAAAIGPVLVVAGVLVSSIGAIMTAFGTASLAVGVMTTGVASAVPGVGALAAVFTALTGPIGIAVAAIAAIGIGAVIVGKKLSEDAIPEVDRFGKGVSEATQKAVGGFLDLNDKATVSLKELSWGGKAVTAEMAESLKSTFSAMGSQITAEMDKDHTDQLAAMKTFYENSKFYGDESRDANLKAIEEKYAQQKNFMATGEETINAIISAALAENRELTDAEYSQINLIKEGWLTQGIQVLSENELETKSILERMKAESGLISAEQAAEVVKNSVAQKDGAVQSANEQYDQSVQAIIKQRDELGTISDQQAQIMISDAKLQRDGAVKEAEGMHTDVVEEAKLQAKEHVDQVNWETGEVLSKWEVFKGKHEETWNKIKDTFSNILDSIKEVTTKAFDKIKETVEKVVAGILEFVKPLLDKFKDFWDENGKAIMLLVKFAFDDIRNNIKMVMGIIQGIFEVVWPIIAGVTKVIWNTIKLTIGNAIDLVLGIIQTVMKLIQGDWEGAWETIKETADKIWKNIVKFFEDVDLLQIGKDIITGLIKGIGSMIGAVGDAIKNIGNNIKDTFTKLFDIHSPSRVMEGYGDNVGQGLAIGISGTKSANQKAIDGVAKVLSTAATKNAVEVTKIATDAEKARTAVQVDFAKKRAELSSKAASSSQAALKTHKDKKGKIVTTGEQKVYQIRQDASSKFTKLNEDEQKKLASINNKAWADIRKKETEISKSRLESVKTYVADKKSLDELSLVAESEVWRKSLSLFSVGSKERVEIQKAYQASLKAINDEVVKVNDEYAGKMTVINDRLRKEEEDLTNMYIKSVDDRAKSLVSFAGIFDEFEVKIENSGAQLLANLGSQVDGFKLWQAEIEKLSSKAIDEGLIEELRAMGPKALPELLALNSLTDTQMSQYSKLYQEKSKLARTQAEAELVGMKTDTKKRIDELRVTANTELEALRSEWTTKIQSITKATDDELKSLKQIGVNAGQGLLNGLASMESSLVAKARSIAQAVSAAMASALQVKSPSRVTMKIGQFVGEGLEVGMENSVASIKRAARMMANAAVPNVAEFVTPQYSSNIQSMRAANASGGVVGGDTYTGNIYVTIDGKTVAVMQHAEEFFTKLKQTVNTQ